MAESFFRWFIPLDDVGEEAIDLSRCRRFVVSEYNNYNHQDGLVYFFWKDKAGDGGRWFRHSIVEEYKEDDDGQLRLLAEHSYEECAPEEAAHDFLLHRIYGDRLPKALEEHRVFGDSLRFNEWRKANGGKRSRRPGRPKPVWMYPSLTFEGQICKEYKRVAEAQLEILNAFETKGWPPSIPNPCKHASLKDSVRGLNVRLLYLHFKNRGETGVFWVAGVRSKKKNS